LQLPEKPEGSGTQEASGNEGEEWPSLKQDRPLDVMVRFGCGALVGVGVVLAAAVGASVFGAVFMLLELFPKAVPVVIIGVPLLFGLLGAIGGNRTVEMLTRIAGAGN
jgi:hypothetical protein